MMRRTTSNPRPVLSPTFFVVKNGSNICGCIFYGVFPASCRSDLTNEPSGVLAPFFSWLVLILIVVSHFCSFPENILFLCQELALPGISLH